MAPATVPWGCSTAGWTTPSAAASTSSPAPTTSRTWVVADLRAITDAVLARDAAAAATAVEVYLTASALRMVAAFRSQTT